MYHIICGIKFKTPDLQYEKIFINSIKENLRPNYKHCVHGQNQTITEKRI